MYKISPNFSVGRYLERIYKKVHKAGFDREKSIACKNKYVLVEIMILANSRLKIYTYKSIMKNIFNKDFLLMTKNMADVFISLRLRIEIIK